MTNACLQCLLTIPLLLLVPVEPNLAAQDDNGNPAPHPVSPGSMEDFLPAFGCFAFSWTLGDRQSGYELEIIELPISDTGDPPRTLLSVSLPPGASSWTPSADQCAAPGRHYAWSIRQEGGEWSVPMLFRVLAPELPGNGAVAAPRGPARSPSARDGESPHAAGLARLADAPAQGPDRAAGAPRPGQAASSGHGVQASKPPGPLSGATQGVGAKALPAGAVAFRAAQGATSGVAYGVVGESSSADGAALAADNTAGGADLVLAGAPSASLTEAGVAREDAGDLAFNFANTGAGAMMLEVDGVEVVTTLTDEDTFGNLGCANGEIAKFGGGVWTCGTDADTADHGALAGLGSDDHPQYFLGDGTETFGGSLDMGGNAIANAASITTGDLTVNGNTVLGDSDADNVFINGVIQSGTALRFEGATVDANETILAITDPTAERTVTFPDISGEVSLLGQVIGDAEVVSALTIDGGSIDDSPVGSTTRAAGSFSTITVGGGSTGATIIRHLSATAIDLVSASIATASCGNYGTITVPGVQVGDTVHASPDAASSADGIEDNPLSWSTIVTAADTVTIRACNPTIALINTSDDQEWRVDVWQH